MCSQSEGVRHLGRERVQARCVATVLPYSCRVGRALLLPERYLGLGEGAMSVGAVLSQWPASAVEAVSAPTMALYCS